MASDGHYETCDADLTTKMPCVALSTDTGTGSAKTVILPNSFIYDTTWNWTVGAVNGLIYVSTAGTLTQTPPSGSGDQVQVVGYAVHANKMFFNPSYNIVQVV